MFHSFCLLLFTAKSILFATCGAVVCSATYAALVLAVVLVRDGTKQELDEPELGREVDARLEHVVRLVLVVARAVDEVANLRVHVDLLEEGARLHVVADLGELDRERVCAVASARELLARVGEYSDDGVLVLATWCAVGHDDDEHGLLQSVLARGAEHERLEDLALQVCAERREARELDLV